MADRPTPLTPFPEGDPLVLALTGALAREADRVTPSPDGLQRIRARIERERIARRRGRGRLSWVLAAAAALLVVAGVELAGSRGPAPGPKPGPAATGPRPSGTVAPTPAPQPSGTPSASGTAAPSRTSRPAAALPVYYIGRLGPAYRLFREFHPAPAGTLGTVAGRVQAAVNEAMSGRPDDPDYRSLWVPSAAATTTVSPTLITIVLNEAAAGGTAIAGGSGDAPAIQQLIWTATAAAAYAGSPAPGLVQIRALGPTPDRFGTIDLTGPFRRGSEPGGVEPRAPVWIDSLGQGDKVAAGTLTVDGEAVGSAAPVSWTLTRGGLTVDSGTFVLTTPSGGRLPGTTRGTWTLQVTPPGAGDYTLTATGAGGSGSDSKDFTVGR